MLTNLWNRNVSPWSTLVRDIDEMFNSLPMPAREPWEYDRATLTPAYDIDETDDHYLMSFDIPGITREDLNIEITGNKLVVSGERKAEGKNPGRRFGKFQQLFTLPEGITAEAIEAECKDGVLRLSIQKPAAIKPTKVTIGDGSGKSSGLLKKLVGEKKAKDTASIKQPPRDQQESVSMAN